MNQHEYGLWEAYFFAAFPMVESWMAGRPEQTRQLWSRALGDVSLSDGKAAVESLLAGDEAKPDTYQDYPREVRRVVFELRGRRARDARRAMVNGEATVSCLTCMDDGTIQVVHPESMRKALESSVDFLDKGTCYRAIVACTCPGGDRWANPAKPLPNGIPMPPLARFDGARMPRWDLISLAAISAHGAPHSLAAAVKVALRSGDSPSIGQPTTQNFEWKCRVLEWLDKNRAAMATSQREF